MSDKGSRSPQAKNGGFDALAILEKVPLLSSLSPQETQSLAQGLKKQEFKLGDYLMKEGEDGDTFYIIVNGKVEVSTQKGGVVATLEAGDYCGEQALLQNTKRNATLTATEATTCLVCNQQLFKSVLASNTSIKFAKREGKRHAFFQEVAVHSNDDAKLNDQNKLDSKIVDWLLECTKDNLLFSSLSEPQKRRVANRFVLKEVKKNQKIIHFDAYETTFYVVESGKFEAQIDQTCVASYDRGGCFGELALLYTARRAADVIAVVDGKVWEVDRKYFRMAVATSSQDERKEEIAWLRNVELFKPLLNHEFNNLYDALDLISWKEKDVIIKEGDDGDSFYVIRQGECSWEKSNGEKGVLKEGDFFGERAIRTQEKRAATVYCKSKAAKIYQMKANDFLVLLGPVFSLVDDKIKSYVRSDEQKIVDEAFAKQKETIIEEQKQNTEAHVKQQKNICKLNELKTIGILGKGGFGLVTLVVDLKTNKSYALKAIRKSQIVELELQKHIISEKRVMDIMNNKFLVNLHTTYKDKLRVYFLLDVCLGGELFTILRGRRYFDEPTAKFFAACVVEAFDYMHARDIIYRDLKPENLVLDSDGYLKVTDFGFAKVVKDQTYTLCGTPDYLCPEIVSGQGHGKPVDWWTLGVLIYEMLASFAPFVADDPIETYRKIIRGRIRFPRYFSQEARDLIVGFLQSKPAKRLGVGSGGANNIRNHPWFRGFDWKALNAGTLQAPIKNKVRNPTDLSNFAEVEPDKDDAKPIDSKDEFDQEF